MFAVGRTCVHVADSKRVSYSQWRAERPQCDVIADPGIRRRGWREEGVELLVLFEALQVAATQTRRGCAIQRSHGTRTALTQYSYSAHIAFTQH